mmetsp:Transcript_63150/g.150569  ORF Transcript_63150/g.150569 Transcript_63150/m.150569 type:complete len:81 (-) Transcript_63150:923-1165(-)
MGAQERLSLSDETWMDTLRMCHDMKNKTISRMRAKASTSRSVKGKAISEALTSLILVCCHMQWLITVPQPELRARAQQVL